MNGLTTCIWLLFLAVPLQEQAPEKAKQLIRKLDADDSAERDAATKALLEMGEAARPSLLEARQGANAEVASRIGKVLELLDFGALASRAPWDFETFNKELNAAFRLEKAEKWKALRNLGIRMSDEEFAKAEKAVRRFQKTPIFEYWVDLRPEQAAAWTQAVIKYVPTPKDDFRNLTGNVVLQWSIKDATAAAAWAEKTLDENMRRRIKEAQERLKPK
jgi:hypothetical protein